MGNCTKTPYLIFLSFLLALNFVILYVPYAASKGDAGIESIYFLFSPTCHQLTERSNCLFVSKESRQYSFGNCADGIKIAGPKDNVVEYEDKVGYKLPVCSRDFAIYISMLAGLLLLPFVRKIESESWPNKWLIVLACLPLAFDGLTQFFGLRESTNELRMATGALAGLALPFYLLPILNSVCLMINQKLEKYRKK